MNLNLELLSETILTWVLGYWGSMFLTNACM